jgi:predicted permease
MLVGAMLFVRSLRNLLAEDLGVDTRRVYSVSVDFAGTGRKREDVSAFYERARERLRGLPGVYQTSLAMQAPIVQPARAGGSIRLPGHDTLVNLPGQGSPTVNYVAEDFFATTGLRLVLGRPFRESDRDGAPVVIVNETMARLYWPGRDAVGQCVHVLRQTTCTTVVGVVEPQHMFQVREESHLFYYRPLPRLGGEVGTVLVRSSLPSTTIATSVRRALQELEPGLPYVEVRELFSGLDAELQPWRLGVSIFTAFGTLAVLLAAIGLASAIAYTVTQRSREIGVRMAVGAKEQDVVLLVMQDGLRIGALGVAIGIALALLGGPRLGDLLYEVSPRDMLVFGGVSALVLGVAIAASLAPALRAAKLDPMRVLRSE